MYTHTHTHNCDVQSTIADNSEIIVRHQYVYTDIVKLSNLNTTSNNDFEKTGIENVYKRLAVSYTCGLEQQDR